MRRVGLALAVALVVALVYLWLTGRFVSGAPQPWSNFCSLKVAVVVGNGPISAANREEIAALKRNGACVVRFNDTKNWDAEAGEPCDMIALRQNVLYLSWTRSVPTIPIIREPASLMAVAGPVATPVIVQEAGFRPEGEGVLFRGCEYERLHSGAEHGPSTGAAVLSVLEEDPRCEVIHVFGMNWSGPPTHVDFSAPETVARCCGKCVVHPTHGLHY
jgi:hypothetical protein